MGKNYYNPISGEELLLGSDGLLHSNHGDTLFAIGSNEEVIPLIDPINGALLHYDKSGNLVSDNDNHHCALVCGRVVALKDPINGANLKLNENGILESDSNDNLFYFNEKGEIVPLEKQYIEDSFNISHKRR